MDTALFVRTLGALFATMNPLGALPMFLTLTAGYDLRRRRLTAVRVTAYCLVMAVVVMFGGQALLDFFGVGVHSFQVAGGIVLMTIALGLLSGASDVQAGNPAELRHEVVQAQVGDVSFYPLAFPMLMGPGTIASLIVLTGTREVPGYAAVAAAVLVVVAVLLVTLWFGGTIGEHLSGTLNTIMTRLMGMILAAISVEMAVAGLLGLFPMLAR